MSKDFDAVGLVRQIRDDIYGETKDMSTEELMEFFRRRSSSARGQLKQADRSTVVPRGAAAP